MSTDKQKLKRTVEDISEIILGEAQKRISVLTPDQAIEYPHLSSDYEFLCEIELIGSEFQQQQIEKLSKLTGREVKCSNSDLTKIYWLEGGDEQHTSRVTNPIIRNPVNDITLPRFIDDYIFNKLSAKYAPDHNKFCSNLDLNKEEVLNYLGTYFPRSCGETYCIYNNVLHNSIVEAKLIEKKEINIIDIGSGTGGNLIGLLLGITESLHENVNFNIIAIDGNYESLLVLEKVLAQVQFELQVNISLNCHYITFRSLTDLYNQSKEFLTNNFDFILSSKLINEIISHEKNSYFDFYRYFADYLAESGLLLLLDITSRVSGLNYLPILLNKQTNNFIQQNKDKYKTLIPTVCSNFDNVCSGDCFCNDIFYITHTRKIKDKSKIAYRIIGKRDFILQILNSIPVKGSIIGWDNKNQPKFCPRDEMGGKMKSAYII